MRTLKIVTLLAAFFAACPFANCQNIDVYGNLVPSDSGALDLGTTTLYWDSIFVNNIAGGSSANIWSKTNDSTIRWSFGGDTVFFYISNGTVKLGSDAALTFQVKGNNAYIFTGTSATQSAIRLNEDTDNGTNYVQLQPPASVAANYTLTFPADDGANTDVLQTNGSGVLSWTAPVWFEINDSTIGYAYSGDTFFVAVSSNVVASGKWKNNVVSNYTIFTNNAMVQTSPVSIYEFDGSTTRAAVQRLFEDSDNGTNYIGIQPPASVAADYSLTLPVDDGTANQFPITNGSGVLSWANQAFVYGNDSTIHWRSTHDTVSMVSYNNPFGVDGGTAIGTQGDLLAIGPNIAESNIFMFTGDSMKFFTDGFEIMYLSSSKIECSENLLPANNGIQNLGSASQRWEDGLINTITTESIIDENSTVNTTAGDAATINAISGRFRKDASGAAFTLTNSYIASGSIIILCPANTAIDATATTWTVEAASGTATITFNAAPTANFDMNFIVFN